MRRSAAEHVSHSISNLNDFKDQVRTCWENLDQQIIDKSIDHWRDKLKAIIWENGGLDTLNRFICCPALLRKRSKNIYAFCHCGSSVTMVCLFGTVLWQKVNLANNQLKFHVFKIKWMLFCVNYNGILFSTVGPYVTFFFIEQLITKGTVFIGPPGIELKEPAGTIQNTTKPR